MLNVLTLGLIGVGVEAVDELLARGAHEVLCQRQVPDGGVRRLVQVKTALIPQLARDLGARVFQPAHGVNQAEGEVLLQPQDGGIVRLHDTQQLRRCMAS